jgi:hypothetical protein
LPGVLWLVHNGVPWHVAAELPPDEHFTFTTTERIAAGIIFGQFNGGKWDWNSMIWKTEN